MKISIGFWNIGKMQDKMEMELVRDWANSHDLIVLSETKTTASPSVPGFVAINNSKFRHGGVAVLVKRYLYPLVCSIDIEDEGLIWFELSCVPGVLFCGIYNEPSDIPYFWRRLHLFLHTWIPVNK